ncbi:MAG: hypothetical protein JWQ90_2629 [Hydrocarboniphaga sp.]|uniref:PaaI family thioesterase n=1 Tax=Hydrocarboniphaga sp. TaxID=2033016 RepID=UPI002611328F|nr:hotdog domain-containing protein [Hydrocarboniphaga sp.]MDB5970179.1 hypothetical protein [Hydrocarboniphaga sp.]
MSADASVGAMMAASPPCVELGMLAERGDLGGCVLRLPANAHLANRDGDLHSGAISILVDTAAGLLASLHFGDNATLDLRVDHLRDVAADSELIASAHCVGGRAPYLAVQTDIRVAGDSQLVATSIGNFIQLRRGGEQGALPERDNLQPQRPEVAGTDAFCNWLNIGIDASADGVPLYRLPFSSRVVSNWELMQAHGGVIGAYLEAVAQLYLRQRLGRRLKTINITTNYLRLSGPSPLWARVSATRLGGRIAALRVDAWQADAALPTAQLFGHFQITDHIID